MINPNFRLALIKLKQDYPVLFPVVAAQWCYESNYGNSKLAREAFNFSGLKYRDLSPYLPKDVWRCVGKYTHKDTKGDTDPYVLCHKASDFVEVYMAFLSRDPYYKSGPRFEISPHELQEQNAAITFLAYIADCGFCGWIPKFEGTKTELSTEYVYRILKTMHSKKYQETVESI